MQTLLLLFLLAAPQLDGQRADEHYKKGSDHFRGGRFAEAIAQFEQATQVAPADARGWRGLGVTYAAQSDFKRAEAPLRKACEIDPRDQDACYYLGLASYNLGRYENASEAYEKALKTAGRATRVRSGMGLVFEAQGRSEDAERELRHAVKLNDGRASPDFDPRVELGAFLFRQGRLDEARAALESAAKARPDSARAHFELARTLVQDGRLEDAASRLKQAVTVDPNYAAAHLLLGRVYFRLGRTAEGEVQTQIGQKLALPKP